MSDIRPSPRRTPLAERWKTQADGELRLMNYQKAIDLYSQVLQASPESTEVLIRKSKAHFNLRQYDQSLSDAKMFIQQHPEHSQGYVQAASTLVLSNSQEATRLILLQGLETVKQQAQKDEITSLLDKIHLLFEQQAIIKLFVEWAVSSKISFPGVELTVRTPFQRLIRAIRVINKHEPVMMIPRSAIICLDDAFHLPLVKRLNEQNARLYSPKHTFLSLYLLHEKAKAGQSIFAPYLNILPDGFPTFPVNFSQDELQELKGSYVWEQIKQKRQEMRCDYNTILKLDSALPYTIDQFIWARLAVCSRVFGISIRGNRTEALVPLADMCNHSMEKQTFWTYNEELEGFVLESIVDIKTGVQIVDSYGKKYNSKFLLNYGFVVEDNDMTEVIIPIPQEMITDRTAKFRVWEKLFGNRILLRLTSNNRQNSFSVLMSIMRFIICTEDELQQIQKAHLIILSEGLQPPLVDFYNIDLQQRCISQLCGLIGQHLESYGTTLDEDSSLLRQRLSVNTRNCVILRREEKELLQQCIKIERMVEKLSKARKTSRKRIVEGRDYAPYRRYLEKIFSL